MNRSIVCNWKYSFFVLRANIHKIYIVEIDMTSYKNALSTNTPIANARIMKPFPYRSYTMHTKTEMILIRNIITQCNIGIWYQYTFYVSYSNWCFTRNDARMAVIKLIFACSLVQRKGMVIFIPVISSQPKVFINLD